MELAANRVLPLLVLVAAVAVLAAGCGGGHTTTAGAGSTTCSSSARTRALAKLKLDLAALRRAAAVPTKNTLAGGPAVNRATDRFLNDVNTLPIDNLVRNRMIDHAAAALVGSCEQCFQALEAGRPIPAIAHGDRGACAP